ncbi:MAG TPA: hypothetical protein VFH68_09335 [Polyangia bacterium]|jgi:hypothetical protein|nr:hypothetical protein [Polyangia bacterium]
MVGAIDFPALIQELHSELNQSTVAAVPDRWHTRAHEMVRRKLHSPFEFLEWAKRDRHWSFTLAEVMGKMCAKPSELAARLLVAILEELREEQQTITPAVES